MIKYAKDIGANQEVIEQLKIYQGNWVDVIFHGTGYGNGYGTGYGYGYVNGYGFGDGDGNGSGGGNGRKLNNGLDIIDE